MIKIITGYRDDQYCLIDLDEAHKAYYLFNNPEARTTFRNGTALIGKNIQGIEPAWNEIMGWNPTHQKTGDDWNEIKSSGKEEKLKNVLIEAKNVAILAENKPDLLKVGLLETRKLLLN